MREENGGPKNEEASLYDSERLTQLCSEMGVWAPPVMMGVESAYDQLRLVGNSTDLIGGDLIQLANRTCAAHLWTLDGKDPGITTSRNGAKPTADTSSPFSNARMVLRSVVIGGFDSITHRCALRVLTLAGSAQLLGSTIRSHGTAISWKKEYFSKGDLTP